MPRIPIIASSNPLPNLPGPVLDRNQRPTVDNRGVMAAAGAVAAASRNPQAPMSLAEPYGALASIGRAVAETGSIVGALALKQRQAETDVQIADADNVMLLAQGEFSDWKREHPDPTQWGAEWEKRLTAVGQRIDSNDSLHQAAREQIGLRLRRFVGVSTSRVKEDAATATFARARSSFVASLDRYTEAQDEEKFNETLNTNDQRGYLYPHEVEAYRQKFKEEGKRIKVQNERDAFDASSSLAVADPQGWLDTNKKPWAGKETLWQRVKNVADSRLGEMRSDGANDLINAIAAGSVLTEGEIDQWNNPALTPSLRAQAKDYLRTRDDKAERADQEANGDRNFAELLPKVKDYNPGNDPDRKQFFELRKEIKRRVGSEDDGYLQQVLYAKATAAPKKAAVPEDVRGYANDTLDIMFDARSGAIPWKKRVPAGTKNGVFMDEHDEEDLKAKQAAIDAMATIRSKFGEWAKANPDTAKDPVKSKAKLMELMPEGVKVRALEALQKLGKPAAAGKVTSYGYPKDATPDSNSAKGIGAFVPESEADKIKRGEASDYKLRDGDLAVSPDVEANLRASGVKPGESIMVKLANGEVRRVRWMDRTANDEQAKALGLSPLRGRFDFYSPSGKHGLDGVSVIGWEKAPSQ